MSLRTYRELLVLPGVAGLVTSSLTARMPTSMAIIALSFWARDATGTFAWSGVLIGIHTAGIAVCGPLLGRWADRFGARRVLVPAGLTFAAGFGVLAALPFELWWLGLGVVALAGAALPPVAPTVRAAWPRVAGGERLRLAYTMEATAQELMFALGPVLSAVLVSFAGSRLALLGCGVVAVLGTLWFASRPALRGDGASRSGQAQGRRGRVLADTGRVGLIAGMALLVASFTATELGIVAFAEGEGNRALSGVLAMVWSLGSFAGGLLAGAVVKQGSAKPWRRVVLVAAGFALCIVTSGVGTWWLGPTLFLAGAMIAPTMAAAYERMGELAPDGVRTEAFAWMTTAGMVGGGIGAAFAGGVVEAYGAGAGFGLAAALCGCAVLALLPAKGTTVQAGQAAVPQA